MVKQVRVNVDSLNYLSKIEKESVKNLVRYISDELCFPCTVILFGSKARGDFHENSDVDLLILSDQLTQEIKQLIFKKTRELNKSNDVFLVPLIPSKEEFNNPYRYSDKFKENIYNDGITLIQLV
jgi:uncharacterized protein